jgi:hypothetical protein
MCVIIIIIGHALWNDVEMRFKATRLEDVKSILVTQNGLFPEKDDIFGFHERHKFPD